MKYLNFLSLMIIMVSGNLSANNILDKDMVVDNNEIFVSVETEDDSSYFLELNYNAVKGSINYKTSEKVEAIHVVNNFGEVVYHLPINSKNFTISKSLLEKGRYTFLFLDKSAVKNSSIVIVK